MATIYGTPGDDPTLLGTNDDDVIYGLAGNDGINGLDGDDEIFGGAGDDAITGAAGNDTITGGDGIDEIFGDAGNDRIIVNDSSELTGGSSIELRAIGGEEIDGGDGIDTLVTELQDGDDLNGEDDDGVSPTIWGQTIASMTNMEWVQVSNASDFMLDLGDDAVFALDGQSRTSTDFATSAAQDVVATSYNATTGAITEDGVDFDETAGITIDGTTYGDGDTFTTASGGEVLIAFNGATQNWSLEYTGPLVDGLPVIGAESTSTEQNLSVMATDVDGNVIDLSVALENAFGADVDLDAEGATVGTRVVGSDNANVLTSGEGDDTLIGNGGSDTFTLNAGDNKVWAGPSDDAGDTVTIDGDGMNMVGLGTGADDFTVNGTGNNTLFGGDGADTFTFTATATGSNAAWGGATGAADTFLVQAGANGNNVLGGGGGADTFDIFGDGNNTLFLGPDDADDGVIITGDGHNTVYGGQGTNGNGSNTIEIGAAAEGNNTVFNGNGDDTVIISGTGDNLLYGGAGDDTFDFSGGGNGTVAFVEGNGLDTITDFRLDGSGTKVDLTTLGFEDADDVLNSMSDTPAGDTLLFIEAGQAITFEGLEVVDFQGADPVDWLVV